MSTRRTLAALAGASIIALTISGAIAVAPVMADEDSIADAFKAGKIIFDLRTRYERVVQDGFDDNASALTTRIRTGFQTAKFKNFSLGLDFETTEGLTDNYNSTTNGNAAYPVVPDPDGTEINQFKVAYTGLADTTVTAGRQVIALGNQRYIGHVGFRQNQQSYDAVTLVNSSFEDVTFVYGYIDKVHRIFGNDHPAGNLESDAHAFNVYYSGLPYGKATGYGYMVGIDAVPGLSTKTFGLRWDGNQKINDTYTLLYGAEYAQQKDHQANPGEYTVKYYAVDAAVKSGGFLAKAGLEILGGNGVESFKTPLATLHKFQGFADAFLNTPADGIKDYYGQIAYSKKVDTDFIKTISAAIFYHDFKADNGSANMGNEVDFSITAGLSNGLGFNLKFADYNGKGFQASRNKVWLTLGYKY